MAISRELDKVAPLAKYLGRKIVVVDVGCRWGFSDVWLPFGRNLVLIGFDADANECERLTQLHSNRTEVLFVPAALGSKKGQAQLHVAREPACSSFFPPDLDVVRHRPGLECIRPVGSTLVDLRTLDDWAEEARVGPIDYIKLDAQGAELGILEGAERCLCSVRALEIEVMFNPIYTGEPLFGDIDRFLRARGFSLWRLNHLVHYGMAQAKEDFEGRDVQFFDSHTAIHFATHGGQITWGHAYYVRMETAFGEQTFDWRTCLLDGCLTCALGFRDLAGWSLERALAHAPSTASAAIREAMQCDSAR